MTTGTDKIKVLVVDDSAFMRKAISGMLKEHPAFEVVDVAVDGQSAVEKVKALRPHVVTLDIKMPVMDGIAALEIIMRECPTPVVMLSSLTGKGGEMTLKALELGAVDFIDKAAAGPMEIGTIGAELIAKLLIAAKVDVKKLQGESSREASSAPAIPCGNKDTEVVLIGTSTGGPPALQEILTNLPAQFPCPILIVQHMPVGFTSSLAERLDKLSLLHVKEAEDGEEITCRCAYIAPAGLHMRVKREGEKLHVVLDKKPADALHIPSVDNLFESAAKACGKKTLAFVLTGMGKDGLIGAQAIKKAGGRVVVESEETCIVYGMPRAVVEEVKVDGVVPLYKVAETIAGMV